MASADIFGATGSPPCKRPKTLRPQQKPMEDEDAVCCGICLTEIGRSIRGRINCCDHCFCFVCIMEWAKVESKCPMCKRRFSTIVRPPKAGVFARERIVRVPPRDQASDHPGVGSFDPYAETRCSVCQGTQDEWCLLLCDLCDSAAHTYCVSLGVTVPQGDWFCHDCTVLRAEHAKNDEADSCNQHVSMPSTEAHFFNINIVRERNISDVDPCTTVVSSPLDPSHFSIIDIVRERSISDIEPCTTIVSSPLDPSTAEPKNARRVPDVIDRATVDSGARTLKQCRNVHARIRVFRENWDALRCGSLSFCSTSRECVDDKRKEQRGASPEHDRLGQPTPSFDSPIDQDNTKLGSSFPGKGRYDIKKAWKMMDRARSKRQDHDSTGRIQCRANIVAGKINSKVTSPSLDQSKNNLVRSEGNRGTVALQHKFNNVGDKLPKHKSSALKRQKSNRCLAPSNMNCATSQRNLSNANTPFRMLSSITYKQDNCPSMTSFGDSVAGPSNNNIIGPSSASSQNYEGKGIQDRVHKVSHPGRDGAKSEIQSLVKLNLKLLGHNKKIGVHLFKEIARTATHTILAACGLEPSKLAIPCPLSSVCHHTDQFQRLNKSNLMPNCCRECFYAYVKKVVDSVMLEKVRQR